MEFVLASHNQKKLAELRQILVGQGISIDLLPPDAPEPEENGQSFRENALIKARAACTLTGKPAIADDSGLCVDALDGAPGIHSARYCQGTDADRNKKLLFQMRNVPDGKRGARFVSAVACVFPDGQELIVQGECAGQIQRQTSGAGGFGYDPIFYVPEQGCSFAQLPAQVKNQISHRGQALNALAAELTDLWQKKQEKQGEQGEKKC